MKAFEDVFKLEKCKDWHRTHTPRALPGHLQPNEQEMIGAALRAPIVVVTARDPYLSAIRWINRPGRTVEDMGWAWQHFFKVLEKRQPFVVDIGCRETDRVKHLCDLGDYLEVQYDAKDVQNFANAWKPENSINTGAKQAYLTTGTLPHPRKGSWDLLDGSVEWYKNLSTNDYG
jgi:hypothetical protein